MAEKGEEAKRECKKGFGGEFNADEESWEVEALRAIGEGVGLDRLAQGLVLFGLIVDAVNERLGFRLMEVLGE